MKGLYYFKGEYVEPQDISVSPFDYGFNFGAGIYEVLAFCHGVPFQLAEHMERLCKGGAALGIPVNRETIEEVCSTLVKKSKERNGYLYIQMTFGDYGKRNHRLPQAIEPNLLVYTFNVPSPSTEVFNKGFSIQTTPNIRWQRCEIKTISLLPNIIALREAVNEGFDDCLFVDENGHGLECSAANIFFVDKGILNTPPETNKILPGITRATVIELARESGIQVNICDCSIEQFQHADEVFITSTTKHILPIQRIDNESITFVPGKVTKHLFDKWTEFLEQETSSSD
jgi:D-alanine transaminase